MIASYIQEDNFQFKYFFLSIFKFILTNYFLSLNTFLVIEFKTKNEV